MTSQDLEHGVSAEIWLNVFLHFFNQSFRFNPAGTWFSPGGLTIFGEPTDRFTLAIPTRWGSIVGARARDDGMLELRSMNIPAQQLTRPVDDLGPIPVWASCPLKVVTTLQEIGEHPGGASVFFYTIVPEGYGLSSDSALRSAVAATFEGLHGTRLSLEGRRRLGRISEQLASLWCPDLTAILVDTETLETVELPFDVEGAGLRLVMIDLRHTRPSPDSAASAGSEAALGAAARLREGDLAGMGECFGGSEGLAPEVAAVREAAIAAGALGAGLAGAPAPDAPVCMLALVPVTALGRLRTAVRQAWGFPQAPRFLTTTASRDSSPLYAETG
jgi:galactokinase